MEQNVEENRPKRPRSGTDSPTSSDRQKIPKHSERTPLDTSEENCEQLKANINMEEQQSKALNNTNNMIEAILSDLKIIHGFSEKDSFEPSELTEMRKASFQLHEVVTRLAYKVGKLETENCLLNKALFELKNAPVTASTSEGEQIILAEKQVTQQSKSLVKTYSSLVTKSSKVDSNNTDHQEEWKTPPKTQRFEVMIKPKNNEQESDILKEMKKILCEKKATESFKNVRRLQSGKVIVECHTEDQQRRLQGLLNTQGNLQTIEFQNNNPMLMITGIDAGYKPEDFVDEFIRDNPQIKVVFGEEAKTKIKFIFKKTCRNKYRENWILQTTPDIFKWLIRNENLTFDLTKAYVQEYINLTMCYKCSNFGHVAKNCKGEPCCYNCGDKHDSHQCSKSNPLNCPNCKRLNLSQRTHSARDPKCPAFLRKVQKQREYTNFL